MTSILTRGLSLLAGGTTPPNTTPADELTIVCNGRRISGWTEIHVARGIERCPNSFEIAMTELFPGEFKDVVIQKGDPCQVLIGPQAGAGDLVITGYVDRVRPKIGPTSHGIRVVGRGKCQDLVDCAAEWPGGQISGANALVVAQKLAQPYGITVAAADVSQLGGQIPQFNLILGESAWEIIERIGRYRALLAYEQPDGSLLLSQVGTVLAGGGFTEGVNVQEAEAEDGMDERFSEYQALLQSMDVLSDLGAGGNLLATVTDTGVPRHRRRIIIAEAGGGGADVAKQRAIWEMNRRAGRSSSVRVVTDSWRDPAGKLWAPNTLAPIALPTLKLPNETWLIGEVTYSRNGETGTTAELQLMPPAAFEPEPILLQPVAADVPAGVADLSSAQAPR